MKVTGFNHLTITVSDLERSLHFYTKILGMNLVHQARHDCYLEWGDAWICLVEKAKEAAPNEKTTTIGVDHVAFSIDEEHFDEAVQILQQHQVPIVRGPIERGLGRSINFLDPDHIQLELYTSNLHRRMKVWK